MLFSGLPNPNISIASSQMCGTTVDTVSTLPIAKCGAPTNNPAVVQIPQAHLSSQNHHRQESQHVGLITNAIPTIPTSGSENHAVPVQNSEATPQQQQLIAAAMASLATSIPNTDVVSQQTVSEDHAGNKSMSSSIAGSIYQGKIQYNQTYSPHFPSNGIITKILPTFHKTKMRN